MTRWTSPRRRGQSIPAGEDPPDHRALEGVQIADISTEENFGGDADVKADSTMKSRVFLRGIMASSTSTQRHATQTVLRTSATELKRLTIQRA